jgi:fibronectin-binding autotransporter adhesin
MVVSSSLTVASSETIARPIVLEGGASLDNRGTVGLSVDTTAIRADQPGVTLVNAGTILGDVQMSGAGANSVTLVAGGTIRGDLDIGTHGDSSLSLNGGAGTVQRYSQAVTGDTTFQGALAKSGDGTWIIDSDNLGELGQLEIDGGSLQIVEGGPAGIVDWRRVDRPGYWLMAYLRHGELVFDRSDDVIFAASIMSDASLGEDAVLVQAGTGTLVLAQGLQTPAGIRIERGTLQFDDSGDRITSEVITEHTTNVENNGVMVFDTNKGILIWSGSFSGTGSIVIDGSGFLVWTGANTYTGGTTIKRGSLAANTFLPGDVTVDVGGVFSPTAVAGDVFSAGRVSTDTWFIDGDTEHVTVGGNYHQAATGTLRVVVGTQLDVGGTATLEGGTLELYGQTEGYVANDHTVVLTAAGGLTGTFDQMIDKSREWELLAFTVTSINYDANSVWLETQALDVTVAAAGNGIGYTPASMNSAERVQGAFEQLNDRIATDNLAGVSGDFLHAAGQFQRAPSIEAAQASLRSLSGQLHAASAAMTFRAIDAGNQALSDHLDGLRDGHNGFGMWTQQLGSGGGMARSGFDGVGFQLNGWLVGNDYRIGQSGVAGFAFGQGMGRQQLQNGLDRDDSHRTEGMFYAGLAGDYWYSQGRLGFGHVRQDVNRRLLLGDTTEGVSTRYDGRYQVAYGESGLRFGRGDMRLTPFVSVEYARSDRDGFAEQGAGGFGLRSDAQALERWQAAVGVRAARRWDFGSGRTLDFGAHAQWRRTLGANGDDLDASFVGLQQWSPLLGIGRSRYGGLLGLGLDAGLSPRATLKLAYDYERGQYDSAQGISAGLNVAF